MQKFIRSLFSVLLLVGLVAGTGLAQNRVLAHQGSYQLTEADLASSVELLNFLIQGQLTQDELLYLAQHSANDFQKNPAQFLQTTAQLTCMINQLKVMNNPEAAAQVRLQVLGDAAAFVQNRPYQEWPVSYQLLFKRAPVVAYDSNSKMVLTQQDLAATLQYMGQAYINQGQNVTQQDMEQAAMQIAGNFASLDRNSQMILGSGTILLQLYQTYPQMLATNSQTNYTQGYDQGYNQGRTTSGGPVNNGGSSYSSYSDAARHRAVDQQIMTNLYDSMNQNHATMMNYLETDPNVEWSYTPSW
jgi:hypothetical protein